jgi:DNA-directed RNA polymerase subunit beta
MERAIKEKRVGSTREMATAMPHDLINAKAGHGLRFASSSGRRSCRSSWIRPTRCPRSTHKRRLSALGPGGLSRERAGFEVRDVHPDALRAHLPD